LLRSFGADDVVGFQTQPDADNFRDCIVNANAGVSVNSNLCEVDGRGLRAGAFPIGIDTEAFVHKACAAGKNSSIKHTLAKLDQHEVIIGVDRLDYSKGLTHRVQAFSTFLDRSPGAVRRRVTMLQITPKSRSDVPEYARMQRELAEEVGRINGKFGDVDWTPLRYTNKPMSHAALAGLYRKSRVGLVTPLRDGMNLVAKEYVAAQAPDDPGVLILSQFAGAAHELKSALIVNPYDIEATADAIARAFAMPLEERKDRWHAMMAALRANSVHDWASHFLEALTCEADSAVLERPLADSVFMAANGEDRLEPRSTASFQPRVPATDSRGPIRIAPPVAQNAFSRRVAVKNSVRPLSKAPKRRPAHGRTGPVIFAGADTTQPILEKPPAG
ncbi:MAG: alpha,alpha-trehalose-phosphate synthase (UDP-forming), partial [Methylocella sp.]